MPDPLSAPAILRAVSATRFSHVEVHHELDSTQTFLVSDGGRDGRVVIAEHQSSGRGRLGRAWSAPSGSSLLLSVLLRDVSDRAATLAMSAGVSVARALCDLTSLEPGLKWPNDVRIEGRKICGILGELNASRAYAVVGIGINVHQTADELPAGVDATSLALEGAATGRNDLAIAVLRALDDVLRGGWLDEYRARSETVGRMVRVEAPGGTIEGMAEAVRDDGALIVDGRAVLAGDVVHSSQ